MKWIKEKWNGFWRNESGMGVVEVILIIIVLIGLVVIFQERITEFVGDIFDTVVNNADGVK